MSNEAMRDGEDRLNGKFDADKVDVVAMFLDQFPRAIEAVAWRTTAGARKYSKGGWRKVPNGVERYKAARGRHEIAEGKGEKYDTDPSLTEHLPAHIKLTHADAIAWNAMARLELELKLAEEKGNNDGG